MPSQVLNKRKLNHLRRYAEESGDERDAVWLVHPQPTLWHGEPYVCFHRVDHTGFPRPYAGDVWHREIHGPIPAAGYWWVDTDGTLVPFDGYNEPDERYYSFCCIFGFH